MGKATVMHIVQSAGYGVTVYLESLIQGLKGSDVKQLIICHTALKNEERRAA